MARKLQLVTLLLSLTCSTLFADTLTAKAPHGMAVSAQHYATQIGTDVLKQGGNAIDAAVAMGYALAVVHPCCGNIGGGGFMVIHFANGKNIFVNFREQAPANIKANMIIHNQRANNKEAYQTIGIPGTVLGLNTVLQKYGTRPLDQLIQPAIDLAKNGYTLTDGDLHFLHHETNAFKTQPNVTAVFLKQGQPFHVGDRLIQKNLAQTLQLIAQQGTNVFYHGIIADKIIAASQQYGGVLTKKDFAEYRITFSEPLICHYHGYQIITSPPPSSGGITLCEILNIVSTYPLQRWDYRSLQAVQTNVEAMRYAYADKERYIGDPNFYQVPTKALLSDQHAADIRQKIIPNIAGNSALINFAQSSKEKMNTTAFTVADKFGNVVAVTYTINDFFGARVIASDTGFFLNNEMQDFTFNNKETADLLHMSPNALAPHKRPTSSIAPTIILDSQNRFYLAMGSPGGPTIPSHLAEIIENVIDHHITLENAINARRYHMQWQPDQIYLEPDALSENKIVQLKEMGYKIHIGSPYGFPFWGGVAAIMRNPTTGFFSGVMDTRRPAGMAMGY